MQHVDERTRRKHSIRQQILEQLAGRGRDGRDYFREREKWDVSVQDDHCGDLTVVIEGPRHVTDSELAAALDAYERSDYCHTPSEGFRSRTIAYLFD